jgi:amino acid permease
MLYFSPMESSTRVIGRAALAMLGTIIGAGVFALPTAFKESGLLIGSLVYWLLAMVMLATNLLYIEVIFRNSQIAKRRLAGQVGMVLGRVPGVIAKITHPGQIIGACLAYVVIGGQFLAFLSERLGLGGSVFTWQLLFWLGGAATTYGTLKFVAKIESALTWMLIALMAVAIALFAPQVDPSAFFDAHATTVLLPLGIFAFALYGLTIISEIAEVTDFDPGKTRVAVTLGTLAAALLMWLFGVFAAAIPDYQVNMTPVSLSHFFPNGFVWLIPVIGFLAVITSYITIMEELEAILQTEFKVPGQWAWALSSVSPLILLFAASRSFTAIVNFVGSVFVSINGFFAAVLAQRVLNRSSVHWIARYVLPILCAGTFLMLFMWRILEL